MTTPRTLRRHYTSTISLWEAAFQYLEFMTCMMWPGVTVVLSYLHNGSWPTDPWLYGLIGIGALLSLIYWTLKDLLQHVRSTTDIVFYLLKDPDEDDRVISWQTYDHLRRRLGLTE
jgi:hypothetical protein